MELYQSLNPLNQVYVFNRTKEAVNGNMPFVGLNPLNQVYVFNTSFPIQRYFRHIAVLIP